MNPLERLAVCAGKTMARIEMLLPGIFDDALESDYEAALVEAEAESEVHELPRQVQSLGIDERDAQWVSKHGTSWRWDGKRWWSQFPGVEWLPVIHDYLPNADPPYTAVDLPATDWNGWAEPAIREVLAEHMYTEQYVDPDGWFNWIEDIAPILAARIGCDPQRAIEALSHYKPDRVSP